MRTNAVSLKPYGERLALDIRPSRLIASLLLAMHVTAAVVCAQLPLAVLGRLVLLLAVLGSLMWNCVIYWRRTPKRLLWSPEQGWRITDYAGTARDAELLPTAYLGNWFLIAHFRLSSGRKRTVMLAPDSCNPGDLRRLRVLLRYGTPKH